MPQSRWTHGSAKGIKPFVGCIVLHGRHVLEMQGGECSMTTNPGQGKRPDPADTYGGYGGYRPAKPSDDPYGAYGQRGAQQQSDPDYAYGQQQQTNQGQGQQQQFAYQPPESVRRKRGRRNAGSSASAASAGSVTTDQEDRKFALFSYLGFCFTGIAFFFLKGKRQFVRFHAAQSVFLFGPAF